MAHQLILDRDCEVFTLLEPAADQIFDDLATLEPPSGAICVVGRTQTCLHTQKMQQLIDRPDLTVIFCNTSEGSDNTKWHLEHLGLADAALAKKLLLITGGQLPDSYANLVYHSSVVTTADMPYNQQINQHSTAIFANQFKPYQFLFLNGRTRRHRKYLIERLEQMGLLSRALWTDLLGWGYHDEHIKLWDGDINLMLRSRAIQYLPAEYELPEARARVGTYGQCYSSDPYVKYHLFGGTWHDGAIYPRPYQDTYFSLVTETMFEYPYTFVTEKIAKPLMIGHPWITCANTGFYRYVRNLGFRTFGHVIDESFDAIVSDQDRVERVAQVVADLCSSDLASFVASCQDVCNYNQYHLKEFVRQQKSELLSRFFNFVKCYQT